jgi:hypothetical protein
MRGYPRVRTDRSRCDVDDSDIEEDFAKAWPEEVSILCKVTLCIY